jgi:GlcNAc-P-P-Und epimerase
LWSKNLTKILVTGGSGFIGTNLVEELIRQGDEVLSIDIAPPRNESHVSNWRKVDVVDLDELRQVFHDFQPELVVHLAARTDLDGRKVEDYAANTIGVENVVKVVSELPSLRRVLFASSRLVCRIGYQPISDDDYCPTTPYGMSKVVGERIVRESAAHLNCVWTIVRPTSIWGPWFEVPYKTFFLSIAKGRYVHPGQRKILKSFGYVGNTVSEIKALLAADQALVAGHTLYLADYPPIDVKEMADCIQSNLGTDKIRSVNIGILRAAALVGDCLAFLGWRNPPLTSFRLNNLLTPMEHDTALLQKVAGPLPYSMADGVAITVDWMRSRGEV